MNLLCQSDKTIFLTTETKIIQVFIQDITYIESDIYLSTFHIINTQETETFSILIKELESLLSQFYFFRISRQILLNMRYFKRFEKKNRRIVLINNEELTISYRKISKLKCYIQKIN